MSRDWEGDLEPRMQAAIRELKETILEHYPGATFSLSRGIDEPEQVLLTTTVDLEDPEEVLDLVLDRLLELEVNEGIPLYVIPSRTPERTLAELASPRPRHRVHVTLYSVGAERVSDESA